MTVARVPAVTVAWVSAMATMTMTFARNSTRNHLFERLAKEKLEVELANLRTVKSGTARKTTEVRTPLGLSL